MLIEQAFVDVKAALSDTGTSGQEILIEMEKGKSLNLKCNQISAPDEYRRASSL